MLMNVVIYLYRVKMQEDVEQLLSAIWQNLHCSKAHFIETLTKVTSNFAHWTETIDE